jgi:hypothetical protein
VKIGIYAFMGFLVGLLLLIWLAPATTWGGIAIVLATIAGFLVLGRILEAIGNRGG